MNEKNAFIYALESPNGQPHDGHIVLVSFGQGCNVEVHCNDAQTLGLMAQLIKVLVKENPFIAFDLMEMFKHTVSEALGIYHEEEDEEECES